MSSEYKSSIANEISGFIAEKRSVGFKYIGEERIMRRFDEYWFSHGFEKAGLSPDTLAEWLVMSESEGAGSLAERISVIRQFSIYLNGLCIPSYIPPIEVKYNAPLPHIFTDPELQGLFAVIDDHISSSHVFFSKRIANEYPVLYRLIYLNGLRISEACKMATSEVDLDNGILTILDGKGRKDRLIYLSDDMSQLCTDYLKWLENEIGKYPKWLFPGRNVDSPIDIGTVEKKFNEFWEMTSFSNNCSIKPTVHDLRHTFVVDRINKWSAAGLDFEHMLPYLSKFLGHKSFNETFYYYHYAKEATKNIHKKDTTINKVIPEVMRR